jgi:hypothetical protein
MHAFLTPEVCGLKPDRRRWASAQRSLIRSLLESYRPALGCLRAAVLGWRCDTWTGHSASRLRAEGQGAVEESGPLPLDPHPSALFRSRSPMARHQCDMLETMVQFHPGSMG